MIIIEMEKILYEDVNAFIEAFKNYAKNISNDSNEDLELFPSINTYFENKDI